jgi:hypothetical protein
LTRTRGPSVEEVLLNQMKQYLVMARGIAKEADPRVLKKSDQVLHDLVRIICEIEGDTVAVYLAVLELAAVSMDAMITSVDAELIKLRHRNN